MRSATLFVAGLTVTATLIGVVVPACTAERKGIPTPRGGDVGAGSVPSDTSGEGGGAGEGGRGSGGEGGAGGDDGRGGGPASLPECACLLDTNETEACRTCVQFGVVDECGEAYAACQNDADCIAIDDCIVDTGCENSACLARCRDLGTPEARDLVDAMYACACEVCNEDCDGGDSCR